MKVTQKVDFEAGLRNALEEVDALKGKVDFPALTAKHSVHPAELHILFEHLMAVRSKGAAVRR
jgi:hypothetical protein